jgi:3D (Asp-Asp-Asp) domain-containing protein/septal ring factor EnvC (AmiA/AmiB activator)
VFAVRRLRGAALTAALCTLLLLGAPAPGGADSSSVQQLREQNQTLSERSHSALVELYSLESRLRSEQARVDSLRTEIDAIRAQRASVQQRLASVHRLVRVSQRQLEQRLVRIYEEGQPDALAIVLGSESLRDAVTNLDHLHSLTGQDRYMLGQARRARATLVRLTASLKTREANLSSLEQQASAAAADLDAARSERESYLADLANQRQLNTRQISSLEQRAQAADRRSSTIAAEHAIAPAPAPTVPTAPSPPIHGTGRALTVVATAYALQGTTATGVPVGPGIVAVDPNVIPFGTHMTIPGYGDGVAADTGSAIIGNRIDVWVPTERQAVVWGVQTITIYLHD